jgi:hypothetical protein
MSKMMRIKPSPENLTELKKKAGQVSEAKSGFEKTLDLSFLVRLGNLKMIRSCSG